MKYFVMFRKSISSLKTDYGDDFDGPVAKTLPSHRRGLGSTSVQGKSHMLQQISCTKIHNKDLSQSNTF